MATHNKTGDASENLAILPITSRVSNMTEDKKLCAICQREYYPRQPREWFCNYCYNRWKKDILSRLPWVKFCISSELNRRRQEKGMRGFIFLGSKWDISTDGHLAPRDDYYNG